MGRIERAPRRSFDLLLEMSLEKPGPESKAIVFVVDDDVFVRVALESLVRSAGFKVDTFASAQDFLDHRKADGPSCLVLDVRLPGLSGLDLQKRIVEANREIPIVFITGHGDVPTSVRDESLSRRISYQTVLLPRPSRSYSTGDKARPVCASTARGDAGFVRAI